MESQRAQESPNAQESLTAQESLDALEAVRATNVQRLQRPHRYWVMVASLVAVFALIPLTEGLAPLARFLLVPTLLIVIALIAGWKQPTAVRKIRLRGIMWLPLGALALAAGAIGGLNTALYGQTGWWWLPIVSAALLFTLVNVGGPAMDGYWARKVSNREPTVGYANER